MKTPRSTPSTPPLLILGFGSERRTAAHGLVDFVATETAGKAEARHA